MVLAVYDDGRLRRLVRGWVVINFSEQRDTLLGQFEGRSAYSRFVLMSDSGLCELRISIRNY